MSDSLVAVLQTAKELGFLGPGEISEHLSLSRQFAEHLPRTGSIVDLGSGGGVPAFGAALELPGTTWTLVERSQTRADALVRFVGRLGLTDRMVVTAGDAALIAHEQDVRGRADGVTARGFAPPDVTVEIAAGFLRVGGVLVVSQGDTSRATWEALAPDLERLGLRTVVSTGPIRVLRLDRPVDAHVPRRKLGRRGS